MDSRMYLMKTDVDMLVVLSFIMNQQILPYVLLKTNKRSTKSGIKHFAIFLAD